MGLKAQWLLAIVAFYLLGSLAPGQISPPSAPMRGGPHAVARRMDTPPNLDGKIAPGEWDAAFKIDEFRNRLTGQPPEDATEAWVGYDDKYAYFAFRCHDAQPGGIIGREVTPNASFKGEDTVTVFINSRGSRTFDANSFTVNALGTKSETIAGGRAEKREWRGEWRAAVTRDAEGWSVEMAIPWTMMSYPRSLRSMGLNLQRFQARTQTLSTWANATQRPLPENDGYWDDLTLPDPPRPRPQFLGYIAPEVSQDGVSMRAGFDARYALTPTLYGLVSVAPDFRNIENFIAGIDFTRTERFVADARPFFTEGSGYFNLSPEFTYGDLFYSQRVGDFDIGGKAYGQLSPSTSLGAFAAYNASGQRAAVVNINRAASTSSSNVFVTLDGENGRTNSAAGGKVRRRYGAISLVASLAGEQDEGTRLDSAGSFAVEYDRPQVFSTTRYYFVTPGFAPALGFIPWRNRKGFSNYTQLTKEIQHGSLRFVSLGGTFDDFRTYTGILQQGGYSVNTSATTRNDLRLRIGRQRYTYAGKLDEITSYSLGVNINNRFKQATISREEGIRNDLPSRFTRISGSYRFGSRLDLALSQSILDYRGTTSQTIVTAGYQLSPTRALTGRAVMRKGDTNLYAAYRSAGGTGTELFVILGDPNATTTQARLSLKLVFAF